MSASPHLAEEIAVHVGGQTPGTSAAENHAVSFTHAKDLIQLVNQSQQDFAAAKPHLQGRMEEEIYEAETVPLKKVACLLILIGDWLFTV